MRLPTLTLALLLVTVGTAQATTYYVATTGNDTNPGTQRQPFLTIQKGADVVSPGDTVIVKDGTYVSAYVPGWEVIVRMTRSGTASQWITFKSENPLGAKLDGQNNAAFAGLYLEAGYIRIEGFDIYGVLNHGIVTYASHVQAVGNHIHEIGRVCVWSPSLGLARVGVSAGHITDLAVENNTFNDIGRFAAGEGSPPCTPGPYMQQDHGLYLSSVDNVILKNNIFYNLFRGYPIHFYDGLSSPTVSTNVKILNNTMSGAAYPAGSGHIMLSMPGVSNAVIENNISYQPKNGFQIVYYLQPGTLSNVVARNNITYQGVIDDVAKRPPGISFSGNLDNTDPRFVSPSAHDFHLQAGSPAINAGIASTPPVTTDFDGIARPQGSAYDIGAYEYVPAAPSDAGLPSDGGGGRDGGGADASDEDGGGDDAGLLDDAGVVVDAGSDGGGGDGGADASDVVTGGCTCGAGGLDAWAGATLAGLLQLFCAGRTRRERGRSAAGAVQGLGQLSPSYSPPPS